MYLSILGFLEMSFTDILDILLLAILIFILFEWIRGSSAMSIFVAIVSLYFVRILVSAFGMKFMTTLLDTVLDVGVVAIIVIFQPEIRKFLIQLGNKYMANAKGNSLLKKIFSRDPQSADFSEAVNEIADACNRMSESKTGALIVIQHKTPLEDIISTGDRIDATIHRRLIMNLFIKNSPLHDGAMIISNGKIVAARCTLPITEKTNIPARFGMRHKAAIGVTEDSDADAIVVSEETGRISFVRGGEVTPINNINELKLLLTTPVEE
jgi:uncharacterized protein (TIGR00159 family)